MTVPASWAKLTMYDRVMHKVGRHFKPALTNALRVSRPFVVTPRAAERVRDAMVTYPELIAENAEFAIPPFEFMWIEFPGRVMLAHDRLSGVQMATNPTSDVNIGYLIEGNHVMVFAEGDDLDPVALPIRFRLNTPMSHIEQQFVAQWFRVSRIGLDPFLWGHTMYGTLGQEHQRMLRASHSIDLSELAGAGVSDYARSQIYRGSAGQVRNILALLLMINQPAKVIQTREVPHTRGLVKGKPTSYWGHSLIDIDLDRRRRVNVLAKPKRGTSNWHMRWHEVRGHFMHHHARGADHAHEWYPDHDRERHWHCGHPGCRATRAWREYPNGHGSAAVGYNEQVRRIKTRHDA